jgi:anti-sigma factor RsiW
MTEMSCLNEELRDRLPALVYGTLSPVDEARVRAHVAGCAACAAELALIETSRHVLVATGPRIDTAAIVAAVTAPSITVVRGGAGAGTRSRRAWIPRQYLAAAASLLVVASLAIPEVRRKLLGGDGGLPADSVATAGVTDTAGLALAGGLADLSEDDLATLLAELEAVEPTVASEPGTLRTPLVDAPEGP